MTDIESTTDDDAQRPFHPIPLPALRDPECAMEAAWVGDTVVVRIQGSVDARNAEEFGAWMQALREHLRAEQARLSSARVDLRGLDFVNSWGLKAFVAWATETEEPSYPIVLVLDPTSHWQKRSFHTIAAIGAGRVLLEASS
jgi:anti-anti-sigma factor